MNINNGWIKLHRRIKNWEWFDNPPVLCLWIHILFLANWEDKKWHGKLIKRGSFITSYAHLSDASGLSIKQVRLALEKLLTTGEIDKQSTNKYTLIIVQKYDEYQLKDNQRANKGQTKDKQRATTKEYKEYKNIKRESKLTYLLNIPQNDLEQITNDFELTVKQLQDKGETLHSYCLAHGKKYKNYRAFLLNAIRKDFKKRPIKVKPVVEKEFTPEQLAANREAIAKIKSNFRLGVI